MRVNNWEDLVQYGEIEASRISVKQKNIQQMEIQKRQKDLYPKCGISRLYTKTVSANRQ